MFVCGRSLLVSCRVSQRISEVLSLASLHAKDVKKTMVDGNYEPLASHSCRTTLGRHKTYEIERSVQGDEIEVSNNEAGGEVGRSKEEKMIVPPVETDFLFFNLRHIREQAPQLRAL